MGGRKKKSPCFGDREVIYSQRRCVLYRKKSTGEVMAETHRSSERHIQCKTSQSACNCLDLTYTNMHVGRGVRVSGPLQSMIYTVLTIKKCALKSRCSLLSQAKMEGQEQLLGVQVLDGFFLSRKKERETLPGLLS